MAFKQRVKMISKICAKCGRIIEYRKKWAKNWNEVKYCSDQCKKKKLTESDSTYEEKILELLSQRSLNSTICPSEVLPDVEKQNKQLMEDVRQAARRLVHKNKIVIMQKNQIVDPSEFKGPIRLKLKQNG